MSKCKYKLKLRVYVQHLKRCAHEKVAFTRNSRSAVLNLSDEYYCQNDTAHELRGYMNVLVCLGFSRRSLMC